jgi:hydrogenase maturation protein HypF
VTPDRADEVGPVTGPHVIRRRLRIEGVVQGVGFRPCLYRLAVERGLSGFVRNDPRGVELEIEGTASAVLELIEALPASIPRMSSISRLEVEPCAPRHDTGFAIVRSDGGGERLVAVTPDAHVCPDCLRELRDPGDRRYRYPFINCTSCGPRYTIVRAVPYDRPNTTMAAFQLCADCRREYEDPLDRRFHAQPVACPACGPRLWLASPDSAPLDTADPVEAARERLLAGEVLAVKGIGGFHLAVDATREEAVARLRHRKGRRGGKPFAIMCRDLEHARGIARIGDTEARLLEDVARPIVLLCRLPESPLAPSVAPGLDTVGVMLPYSPLHHLLLDEPMPPLVMTSGNPSEEPITTDNDEAVAVLGPLCDVLVLHDRGIHTGCDDSVVRVVGGEHQVLRRSRGFVPRPFDLRNLLVDAGLLALGGELKVAVCMSRRGQLVLGRHLGDMTNPRALHGLRDDVERLAHILGVTPGLVVHDLHPDYHTTRMAEAWDGVERLGVQHHHAHLASCLAEHDVPPERPAVGAVFDGTGYGLDGTIWGGELLVGSYAGFRRVAHLRPVALPGGDAAVLCPARTALSALLDAMGDEALELPLPVVLRMPDRLRRDLRAMIRAGVNTPLSSGMGRLFDAVAAIVGLPGGLADRIGYDAQPALELEAAASGVAADREYPFELSDAGELDSCPLVRAVAADVVAGVPASLVSARFHASVARATVDAAARVARAEGLDLVALSGGCFHNGRLVVDVVRGLEARGLEVLRQRRVPCGDGGLSLGQAAVAAVQGR